MNISKTEQYNYFKPILSYETVKYEYAEKLSTTKSFYVIF